MIDEKVAAWYLARLRTYRLELRAAAVPYVLVRIFDPSRALP